MGVGYIPLLQAGIVSFSLPAFHPSLPLISPTGSKLLQRIYNSCGRPMHPCVLALAISMSANEAVL